jgi:hypothetical protein
VFTFRCAGCGKQHVVEVPFEQDYSTPCLRCGEPIQVTSTIVHPVGAGVPSPGEPTRWDEAVTAQVPAADVPLTEAEVDDEDDGGDEGHQVRKRRKRKRRARGDGEDDRDDESPDDEEEEEPEESGPDWEASHYPPPGKSKGFPRWLLIAGPAVLALALAGGGAYFFVARGSAKKAPDKSSVAKGSTKKAAATGTQKSTEPEKPKDPDPPVKPKAVEVVRISAPRLAAELAANAAEANGKYKGAVLEVSGLFSKIENKDPAASAAKDPAGSPAKEPAGSAAKPHAVFSCEEAAICCDLSASPTDILQWRRLAVGRPFTVRGTYAGDGFLHGCELLPLAAPADDKYKGKDVEITGYVKAVFLPPGWPFPTVRLEPDTDSIAQLDCLFRTGDEEAVKKLQTGFPVIVRGTCRGRSSGREDDPGGYVVRIDNCRLTDTTGPSPGVLRSGTAEVLRAYDEDLRPFYLPAPGAEPQVAEPLTLAQLNQEWAADPKALEKKYRNKVLTVSGRVLEKTPSQSVLVLVSGDTAHPLKVRCLFDRGAFEDLGAGPELRVRGRFTGVLPGSVLRLDSCRPADATPRDHGRLTADYLPHRPGRQLTYDVAEYPVPGKKEGPVKRAVFLQQEGGRIEAVITHSGTLSGKGLFDGDDAGKWIEQKKKTAARLPGPVYLQRISGGFVEVGQTTVKRGNQNQEIFWQPVLKLGARAGDSWKWAQGAVTHELTVEKFEERGGRPCAVIKETVTNLADPSHPLEKRHVYVRGVGELEQRDWLLVNSTERVIVGEKKLVE